MRSTFVAVMALLFDFQNFLVYMFFLLVVLLLNYSDSEKDTHSLRLRTQLQRALHVPEYHDVSRYPLTHSQDRPSRKRSRRNLAKVWRVKKAPVAWKRCLMSLFICSRGSVLMWLNQSLFPRLLDDSALLSVTGSVLLGTPRLRQISDKESELSLIFSAHLCRCFVRFDSGSEQN